MRRLALPVAVLVVLVAAVAGVRASDFGVVPRAISLKLRGHVGPPRAGTTPIAELTLRREQRTIRFQVEEIWVLSGDTMGPDVLHEVEPYTPNMSLAGPPSVLDRLETVGAEGRVDVIGYFRRGARILMLSSVEPVEKG